MGKMQQGPFNKALMLNFMASRNGPDNILCALGELCVESA
jgi:hypothetical protein